MNDTTPHATISLLDRRFLIYKRVAQLLQIRRTHSAVLDHYLSSIKGEGLERRTFIEVGAGITTSTIARQAARLNATFYVCDINKDLLADIAGKLIHCRDVHFEAGDSIAVLTRIAASTDRVDFAFLDSAPSALRTFSEFQVLEPLFRPGAIVVSDNASLPGTRLTFSRCRKGKILVPYLLASPLWEVVAWPRGGDSMIAAIRHADPDWSHPDYEWGSYQPASNWERRVPSA